MGQVPRALDPDASPWAGFGAALRALRMRRGLSQVQLGREVHVSGDLIGKIEKAERRPQPDVVARLEVALGACGRLSAAAKQAMKVQSASGKTSKPAHEPSAASRVWVPGRAVDSV